jgi:hypothetical protein
MMNGADDEKDGFLVRILAAVKMLLISTFYSLSPIHGLRYDLSPG